MELLTRSVVLLCLVAAVMAKPVSMPERKLLERLLTIIRKILATYKDPPSPVAEPLRAPTPGPNRHAHIKAHKPLPAHGNLITVPSNSSDKVCTSGDQCPLNKCCLQVPEAPYATCQPLLRSGQTCSWSHYTQRQPKDVVTRTTCPCFIGLVCIQDRSCSCTGGMICDFSTIYCAPFDNGVCRRENVALGKKATISSLFEAGNNQAENAACVAVNGNTNNDWLPLLRNPMTGNCIHTDPNQNGLLFWEVDLGKSYFIKYMSLYPRIVSADRMKHVSVLVDKAICYVFRISPYPQPYYKIECKPSLTGQKVRLEKPPFEQRYGILRHDYSITVCEIQVWVCRQGYYGPECDKECHPFCLSCDNVNGECKGGCTATHYGPGCLQTCLTCVDYNCNDQGICQTSCETGFIGEKCDIICGQICGKTFLTARTQIAMMMMCASMAVSKKMDRT